MARTLNKVMLIGNVGNDPDTKHTPSGIPVTTFRLATSENRKDREGNIGEHTDWHTVVAWRGLADIVNRLVHRGSRVFIEGKIQNRNFEDKAGQKRKTVEIVAETILLLDGKKFEKNGTQIHDEEATYKLHDEDVEELYEPHVVLDDDYHVDDEIPF